MPLISLREFARRNSVSPEAISRAVKAGRLPHVDGKIEVDVAQPVWDEVKDRVRAGRKLVRRSRQLAQVDAPKGQVDAQVDTQPWEDHHPQTDHRIPQVDCVTREIVALTIQLNGAEYKELAARAGEARLSLPAFVLCCCGETWRLDAAQYRPSPVSQGRPVRSALERRTVTIRVTKEMRDRLMAEARDACMILTQYIRKRCGFGPRTSSLPGTDQRYREEDDAWERLKRMGLNPKDYFED
jgi:hypothetical protein